MTMLVGGLVVGAIVGYGAGRVLTGTPISPLSDKRGGYDAGYEAATKNAIMKLEESGLLPPAPPGEQETLSLSGTIKSVSKNSITITADLAPPNPLVEIDVPTERVVMITESTKISKLVEKTPEEQQKEFEAFDAAIQAGEAPPPPPSPISQGSLDFDELKTGDIVSVTADHNIFSEESFDATEILLQELFVGSPSLAPAAAPPPPPTE